MKKIISFVTTLFSLFLTSTAFAKLGDAKTLLDDVAGGSGAGYNTTESIGDITGNIISVALSLVGIIFLALTVYAGYLWMTAQGEESQIEKSKKILSSSIIGLALTVSAYAITALVTAKFGR
jgi:hypothetical protein